KSAWFSPPISAKTPPHRGYTDIPRMLYNARNRKQTKVDIESSAWLGETKSALRETAARSSSRCGSNSNVKGPLPSTTGFICAATGFGEVSRNPNQKER